MFVPSNPFSDLAFLGQHHALLQTVGACGSVLYVLVFILVQSGRLCGNGILYPVAQCTAASCVLVSLTTAFNPAAFIIQCCFIVIALFGIWYRVTGRLRPRAARSPHPEFSRATLTWPTPAREIPPLPTGAQDPRMRGRHGVAGVIAFGCGDPGSFAARVAPVDRAPVSGPIP